jgi:hypothetical protein
MQEELWDRTGTEIDRKDAGAARVTGQEWPVR